MEDKFITIDNHLLNSENAKIDKDIKESIACGGLSVFTKEILLERVKKSHQEYKQGKLTTSKEVLAKLGQKHAVSA